MLLGLIPMWWDRNIFSTLKCIGKIEAHSFVDKFRMLNVHLFEDGGSKFLLLKLEYNMMEFSISDTIIKAYSKTEYCEEKFPLFFGWQLLGLKLHVILILVLMYQGSCTGWGTQAENTWPLYQRMTLRTQQKSGLFLTYMPTLITIQISSLLHVVCLMLLMNLLAGKVFQLLVAR